jgi:hypothetical protein
MLHPNQSKSSCLDNLTRRQVLGSCSGDGGLPPPLLLSWPDRPCAVRVAPTELPPPPRRPAGPQPPLYRTAVDPAICDLPRDPGQHRPAPLGRLPHPRHPRTYRPTPRPRPTASSSNAASRHTGAGTRCKPVRCAASSAGWMVPIVDLGRRMGRLDRRERLEDLVGVHGVPGNDPAVAWLQ